MLSAASPSRSPSSGARTTTSAASFRTISSPSPARANMTMSCRRSISGSSRWTMSLPARPTAGRCRGPITAICSFRTSPTHRTGQPPSAASRPARPAIPACSRSSRTISTSPSNGISRRRASSPSTFFNKDVKNFVGVGQFERSLFGLRDPSSGQPGTRSGAARTALEGIGQDITDVNLFTMTALIIQNGGNVAAATAQYQCQPRRWRAQPGLRRYGAGTGRHQGRCDRSAVRVLGGRADQHRRRQYPRLRAGGPVLLRRQRLRHRRLLHLCRRRRRHRRRRRSE